MKKYYFVLLLLFISFQSLAQFAPESDPHRGMYIDDFMKFYPGTSIVDTSRSTLGVDRNFDGIFEKEDAILQYACENHITYLALYDLHKVIAANKFLWNENTHQYENSEKHLCRFIQKAKTQYGITQIGAVGSSTNFFDSLGAYFDRYPVTAAMRLSDDIKSSPNFNSTLASVETNFYPTPQAQQDAEYLKQCMRIMNFNSLNECQSDIDVINIEYEFWGDCVNSFPGLIPIAQSMNALKTNYNSLHPNNPIITEAYLAFLYYCGGYETQVVQTLDGCNNCSPCTNCSNPHAPLIDRVLYSFLQNNPYNFTFGDQNYFERSTTQDSTDFHPMFYSESVNNGGVFDFLGTWLSQASTNTIFFAEEYYFYHWLMLSGSALGTSRQNNVQAGGVHWFTSSFMVGHLDHPKVIQTPGNFCTSNDSALITLDYYGPDEPGTDYTFAIKRDSDNTIAYPPSGNIFSSSSLSTINNPAYRSINFHDTLLFPPCYLKKGEYTATLNLSYNHSTGCTYSTTTKIIVDDRPHLQLVGDSSFCEGNKTFLKAPAGSNYIWYRNGEVINGATTNSIAVGDDGDYYCQLYLGSCNGISDTIHITVHPNPTASVNIFCNGNGTYTLKTNTYAANSGLTDLTGNSGVTYQWSTGETTSQIVVARPASAQRIYVMITDPYSGCTRMRHAALLPVPDSSLIPSITINSSPSTSCTSDGSLTAQLTAATGSVDFFWSNGATSQTINYLPPGTYKVVMTQLANPCSYETSITLGTPPTNAPIITPTIVGSSCSNSFDGSINLNINGGNPPFKFNWNNIPNENGYSSTTQNLSRLFSGTYTLTITDASGCKFTYDYDVPYNNTLPQISASTTSVSTCGSNSNGSASLIITNGFAPFQYLWNDSLHQTNATAINLPAGTVTVLITDGHNCQINYSAHIPSQEISLSAQVLDSTVLTSDCNGNYEGKIFLNISGGHSPYQVNSLWVIDSNLVYQTSLTSGNYTLVLTDAFGCIFQKQFTVSSIGILLSTNPTATSCIGCSNGAITLNTTNGTAPYNFQWTPPLGNLISDTIQNLFSGSYQICVTDSNNCNVCENTTVLDDPLNVSTNSQNESIQIFPNPSNGELTVQSPLLIDNDYLLEVKDLKGRVIYFNKKMKGFSNHISLNLAAGDYLVNITLKNKREFTKRLTILNH